MPELPEVEVLVRHLRRVLRDKTIRAVEVHRPKVLRPTSTSEFKAALAGAIFVGLSRRGKYLLFRLVRAKRRERLLLVGHLGMTGRMYLLPAGQKLPKHTMVVLELGRERFVFEDPRQFGRFTLDESAIRKLGPEPLGRTFSASVFVAALKRSRQPIKVKLLDQTLIAGVGNIYASEALFRARISPMLPANQLKPEQAGALRDALRQMLSQAVAGGSTVPLNYQGAGKPDGLFYFGRSSGAPERYRERLRVYDREGQPCPRCSAVIKRIVQGARSTYFCPRCQRQ